MYILSFTVDQNHILFYPSRAPHLLLAAAALLLIQTSTASCKTVFLTPVGYFRAIIPSPSVNVTILHPPPPHSKQKLTATRKSCVSSVGLKSYATTYSSCVRSAFRGTEERRRSGISAEALRVPRRSKTAAPVAAGIRVCRGSSPARDGSPMGEALLRRAGGSVALAVPVSFVSTKSSTCSVTWWQQWTVGGSGRSRRRWEWELRMGMGV